MAGFEVIEGLLNSLKEEGRYRPLSVWEGGSDSWMTLQNGRRVLQMSSNNYLGLTKHPALKQAAIEAIEAYGVGAGSVRTITGTLDIHDRLERRLAEFKGTEATLVFQSGFTTNQGVLSSILGPDDVVISDELNHASIIDGIRLTKTNKKIYAHKDMNQLEEALKASGSFRQRIVVTDGVFSMDGDIAPLPSIVELAERYDALVYVDDAHASGVLGKCGKGSTDHFGLHGRVHIQVGTLSKAIGAVGGYVASSQVLKDYLTHTARSFLFSTSLPPSVAATCLAAIDVLQNEPELTERLWSNANSFRTSLQQAGFDTGESQTPIIPIIVGDPARTMAFSQRLLEEGICAQGIVYPTVALERGRVRLIVTAQHTAEDLVFALEALKRVGSEFGMI
ncbi:glycine C-acetyltransferase [Paenibacillus alvei]|uniref:8-amino-7-ketopelargonate synthase n=1 Tax=Paenibacillus alvei TaxID=44250 RepID=A0ABT4GVR6_PAEAL|nr:glycine C-acetyltransferase [Paenibacillus alvei]EJW19466.1 8-amino-7-oxononanoate synthase [Paenibacillus alvei DSM 29]MCY7485702.1 glycine C-acetyltransferase [Paenibacillus alvei]MCY9541296.1 glycine C-acetyltransferase [Paenibacillus alvei]MCY9702800.1 glycine C-acetyltransferase [Paenibacillus alvei]MCY9734249.1 glycine C-acetyltransferase [Paenibacillus alvei]